MRRISNVMLPLASAMVLMSVPLAAQDGAALFAENCAPCHNIGDAGGAGPDLRDIAKRHDRAWLLAYVLDPPSKNKAATMPPADLQRDAVSARGTSIHSGRRRTGTRVLHWSTAPGQPRSRMRHLP